jgi:hypothetical protein
VLRLLTDEDHRLLFGRAQSTREQLCELFGRSRFGATPVTLRTEPAGVDVFAFCRKA